MEKLDPKGIENILALTPLQEGMLFHYLQEPRSGLYSEQLSLEISGTVDGQVFEKAWNTVVKTNEMLRTVFRWEKVEKPSQIILKEHKCKVVFHDLSARDVGQKKTALEEIKIKDREEGFDLTQVPFRVILCKLDEIQYEMIVSNHHILYDGWSNGIILKEFFKAYYALHQGGQTLYLPVKPSFKEFIKWIQGQDKNKQEKFWRGYLTEFETPTELPIKRRMEETEGAGEYSITLAEDIKDQLEVFVKNNRVTLASIFYTAWGLLLQKYCGSEDVIFGTTVSGRSGGINGIDDMVGLFINTIPLRTQTAPDEKIIDVVIEADQRLREREAFESTPLVDIGSYSGVGAGGSLFDTIVVIENYPLDDVVRRDVARNVSKKNPNVSTVHSVHSYSMIETTHYDLTVGIIPSNEIEIKFSFNRELFEKDAIENLAGHFKGIIQNILENPETALSQLEMISNEEKNRILYEFNDTVAEYPQDKTIHQLFEEQVEKSPDRIAVIGSTAVETLRATPLKITYRQLNDQADQLAGLLIEKGVQPDTIVGIMMERSIEMVIGIFGILKAGGAYLPIDPEYPEERINYMLKDSSAKLLVTTGDKEGEKVRRWEGEKVLEIVFLDSFSSASIPTSYLPNFLTSHPFNLAYLIYTSGSTGKPKGVLIQHGSVVNRLNWMQQMYPLGGEDIILQKTSFTFDVSVWELFWWSFYGARLCLLVPGEEKDPAAIIKSIDRNHITTMHFVPSMLNTFLAYLESSRELYRCLGVRRFFASGEVLGASQVDRFYSLLKVNGECRVKLINLYGPTEATVDVSYYNCSSDHRFDTVTAPIGKPIHNIRLYVVNIDMRLQPIGIAGELCIAGVGLARGYLNKPELASEKFTFFLNFLTSSLPRFLLYRTGDLARWLSDGNIEFLGRIDHQVKIRGFRIELGEIESRLLKHGKIKEAVVLAKEDSGGDKYLVAYFISDRELSDAELREHLLKDLPDYMIPSYFVQLEKIPLTPSGKVDRKALPAPKVKEIAAYVAPRDEIEKKLVEIWAGILGRNLLHQRIGIDDNFFRLGGHSLKATSLASRIHKEFNVKIPLGEIFKRPTIRGLFDYINKAVGERYVSIEPVEKQEYYMLSSAQKRLYFLQQMDIAGTVYNMPSAWILEGVLDKSHLGKVFTKLIQRHESLRTSFVIIDEEPVQQIHEQVEFEIEKTGIRDQGSDPAWSPDIIKNFIRPFDLSKAPLMRVGLIKIAEEKHIFMVDMHHSISDGMSIQVFVQNFSALYAGKQLPEINIQYKDYAAWQNRERLSKKVLEQSEYWKNEFEGEIPVLELPTDYERPAVHGFEGNSINFEINSETSGDLKALAFEAEATLYMVLLALYTLLLSRLTGQEDIVIGSPVAGRTHADLEKIIGMFVNTLVMRNYPSREKTFSLFLQEVKEKTLRAFENRDYQYEDIVEQISVNRDVSRNPLFDTMFVLQNFQLKKMEIPGLKLNPYEYDNKTSKFDLTLTCGEVEEKLMFTFEYSTKLFREETINRFIGYFKNIVRGVIEKKERRISDFEIITVKEKRQILFDFNDTEAEYPKDKTIHQLFAEQVEKTPDNIALVGADLLVCPARNARNVTLTYRQLNKQSDQLAGLLIEKGVLPDTIVAIMMERSVEMIIGIMGILKSGGAYLPIDPEYPQERIDYMLKDSNAKILINKSEIRNPKFETNPNKSGIRDQGAGIRNLNFEHLNLNSLKGCPRRGLSSFDIRISNFNSSNLAYIIYTSGSTGSPRGVMVEHHNVVRLVKNTNYVELIPGESIMQTGAMEFDASTFEVWGSLLNGLKLVLLNNQVILIPGKLKAALRVFAVSTIWMTSPLFNQMLQEDIEIFAGLKNLLVGGDVLSPSHIGRLRNKYPGLKVINGYGPTENTTFTTTFLIDRDYPANIPIGAPIANSTAYIVDKYNHLQPIGVPGELLVGGDGVARGYLNNPELTHEKLKFKNGSGAIWADFQHSSFDIPRIHYSILYHTGDLARWMPDGNVEFLGRIDRQVKIRGFRIELGEIENQLLRHEDIKEAVVMCRGEMENDKYLCAYIVTDKEISISGLREYLAKHLPAYMIPSQFSLLEKIPLTVNGKIDRKALDSIKSGIKTGVEYTAPRNDIEKKIADTWKEVLKLDDVGVFDNFFEIGGNSLNIMIINDKIKKAFDRDIPIVKMFTYPTIHSLANYLNRGETGDKISDETPQMLMNEEIGLNECIKNSGTLWEIAVIGMAGRFPGAQNIHEFWNNLKNGIESIYFFSEKELVKTGVASDLLKNPNYVKASGVLEHAEYFDAPFFGYTPREAEIMNPQLRIFHECAWEALEDAGYNTGDAGLIGVYAGASSSSYWEAAVHFAGKTKDIGDFAAGALTNVNFLTTMISYKLNLKGPSSFIQTACSTSLAAIHYACCSLLLGECHMALAGGVGLNINQKQGYLYEEGMISSPDGHCRAFDAQAKGTVGGNGVGIVVLKRLKNAIADRDNIYAVIKGIAINNDGNRKVGYTAPSVLGQAEAIRTAQAMAHVEPASIGYIEAHGTATPLGDPIEIEALTLAFNTEKRNYCPIGSVKSNIGHLGEAAGVAGFIKTVLCLKNKQIPPSLHFKEPNPKIDFKNSPFYVNSRLTEWKRNDYPRRAGVSSFGIGGTNAHVVLEEWPLDNLKEEGGREFQLFLLSAKTQTALDKMTGNLAAFLNENRDNPAINLSDTAYTLMVGRKHFDYRRMIACKDIDDAITTLSTPGSRKVHTFFSKEQDKPVIFMFPGLGSQYVNMGRKLFETEPVFRDRVNHCFEILKSLIDDDIKEILYPGKESESAALHEKLKNFEIAQPVIFIFEYALAQLLLKWGITPTAMIGYSFGEYVAACLAGVFSLEEALKLIVSRGKLISRLADGAMLSVPLPKEELIPLLNAPLAIAIDNGPSCIIAGPGDAIETLQEQLKAKRCMCMPMDSSYAIHSKMMTPVLAAFTEIAGKIKINSPQIPYISNLTGTWITAADLLNPSYWSSHLSQTVQFAGGMKELLKKKNAIFIEVGPGRDLKALVGRYFENSPGYTYHVVNLVKPAEQNISDIYYLLNKIGHLWLYGLNVNWEEFYSQQPRGRISLPTYPFEKQKYWITSKSIDSLLQRGKRIDPVPDISGWFYIPTWKRSTLEPYRGKNASIDQQWLVFADDSGLGNLLVNRLKETYRHVVVVKRGSSFSHIDNHLFTLNPREYHQYENLINMLRIGERLPDKIIHLWNITGECENIEAYHPGVISFEKTQEPGFFSLLHIARALGKQNFSHNIRIYVLTNHVQEVFGNEPSNPGKSTILGLLKVIPQEYAGIRCGSIDIELPQPGISEEEVLVDLLLEEFTIDPAEMEAEVAYRNNQRWVQVFDSLHLETPPQEQLKFRIKQKGVFLITGGLGKIGLMFAELFVKRAGARLILTGRSPLPSGKESFKIKKLQELEEMGGKVLYMQADVADLEQMRIVVNEAEKKFGAIDGIIHAAGVTEGQSMRITRDLTLEDCRIQFQTKAFGVLVLNELFKDKPLDFCWLLSSISCVLGGLGFGAYASANQFMDMFAKKHNRSSGRNSRWLSLNWDGMDSSASIDIFERIFTLTKTDRLIVSRQGNLHQRIDRWIKLNTFKETDSAREEQLSLSHPRPNLSSNYEAPRNPTEKTIAGIWQQLLGFDAIGVKDDFLELGGDSLKAITLISRIQRESGVNIPVMEFFSHPTIERIAGYIQDSINKSTYTGIESVEKKEYYLLSSAQLRIYILHRMDMESKGYNIPFVFELKGNVEPSKLEYSFKKLIKRHESFKTAFIMTPRGPAQVIHDDVDFTLEYFACNETGVPEILANFVRPFDIETPPLMRVGLIKIDQDKHILILDIFHIITDGVSFDILVEEFISIYQTIASGNESELPPLRIQYKDYAEWQKRLQQVENFIRQKEYWEKEFEGEIPVLDLPADNARPAVQSFEGNTINSELSRETIDALKAITLETGTTLYMVLLAIYSIFLSKLSGREDIVIGTPVAGRRHTDLERIIGMFVNTLALRIFPSGEKEFAYFLQEVREKTIRALDNQDYQYEDLVEKVVETRDVRRNPLFDTMFALQNTGSQQIDIPGFKLVPYKYENKTAIFDFSLTVDEAEDKLHLIFAYCTKLFKRETVERFIVYFKNIIRSIIENKNRKISDLEILTVEEKRQILFDFNDTERDFPKDKTIHQLFVEQALKTPDRVAVFGHGRTRTNMDNNMIITYRQLNEHSNRLAGLLIEKGVLPDTIVGIMMERSVEMIIGIMGILKSGGAYLPIEPSYPQERIEHMLKDSGAKIMIGRTEERFFLVSPLPRFLASDSSNIAYVIYTSGSTGKPKGVIIEHRAALNFMEGITGIIEFRPGKIILALTTITFDIFGLETLLPLCRGLKVVMVTENQQREMPLLEQVIIKNCVDMVQATPSRMQMFTMIGSGRSCLGNLKELMVGGEALPVKLMADLKQSTPAKIYNMYGPTETTIWSTVKDLTGACEINIGTPIQNTVIYIFDKNYHTQPVRVPGELYIGGDGLARGYLNQPELTAERFIDFHHSKLYRTGDLARWLDDGNIEFLGRIDQQVKIRGFRIELGEIESQLLTLEKIKKAIVLAREDNNHKYLCAYIVLHPGEAKPLDQFQLRAHLSNYLPDYMVPTSFVQLDKIPLTPNGKIDRKALHAIVIEKDNDYVAPRDSIEKKLVEIWADVLTMEGKKIGIFDNFFHLGGSSLTAIKMPSNIYKYFNTHITFTEIFRKPTIKELSDYIKEYKKADETIDFEGINNKLRENFNIPIKLVNYMVENKEYIVLYANEKNREISGFLKTNHSTKITPHYVMPFEDAPLNSPVKIERNSFAKMMRLKNFSMDEELIKPILESNIKKIQKELTLFNLNIKSKNIIDKYSCGCLVDHYLNIDYRSALNFRINIHNESNIKNLEQAVLNLINNHPLFRTIIIQDKGIYKFAEFDRIKNLKLPAIDLSGYSIDIENIKSLISNVSAILIQNIKAQSPVGNLLFNLVALKWNIKEYLLIFVLDHKISDLETGRILKTFFEEYYQGNLENSYKFKFSGEKSYKEFINEYMFPSTNLENITKFKMSHDYRVFKSQAINLKKTVYATEEPFTLSDPYVIEYRIDHDKIHKVSPFAYTLYIGACACSIQFDCKKIPIKVLVNIRAAGGDNYYYTIGDMHDIIPVLFDVEGTDNSPEKCYNKLQIMLEKYTRNKIHFISMGRADNEVFECTHDSTINMNFIGKLEAEVENYFLKNYKKCYRTKRYPILSYFLENNRLILIFYSSIKTKKMENTNIEKIKFFFNNLGGEYVLRSYGEYLSHL